ncbi:MAG: sulfotransferase domain-containing protein [Alphaproteobacteria bacterium]
MPLDQYESGARTVADFLEKERSLFFPNLRLLDANDIFLASFPRSGNDWVRTMLADVLEQLAGMKTGPRLPVDISVVTPGIYSDDIAESYKYRPHLLAGVGPAYLIVKTHHLVRAPDNKVILLYRRPADVFVSYYHFRSTFGHRWTKDGPDHFAEQILPAWTGYMRHFVDRAAAAPDRMVVLGYEDFHARPVQSLARIAEFAGLAPPDAVLQRAVANHAFDNRRAVEDEYRRTQLPPGATLPELARRGEIGEGARTFSPDMLARIEAETGELYRAAGELARR